MTKHISFISTIVTTGLLVSLFSSISRASCFDFSSRENLRLPQPKVLYMDPDTEIARSSGTKTDKIFWAAAIADVEQPISSILEDLIAHKSTKNSRISKMEIKNIERDRDFLHQKAKYVVKPFPFVTVEWTEDWLFSGIRGSLQKPQRLLISYEKTDGTSHIQHLCGNIELKRKSSKVTRVYVLEEVQATQRTQQDTLDGVVSTINRLKGQPSKVALHK